MENLEFVSAKRTSDVEVEVTYALDKVPFTVFWTRMSSDGKIYDYYGLSDVEVKSESETLRKRVLNAVYEGENGQDDEELYLFIRDKFDSTDAENLEDED